MPSGSQKTGTGTGRKSGWLGNGTGVGCNVMRLLLGKRPLLAVRLYAVAGDSNGVDVVSIVVWIDEFGLDSQRQPRRYWGNCHPQRYWGNCHPWRWWWNRQDCRLLANNDGECRLRNGALEYFGEVNNGLLLGVAKLGKRGIRGWIGEGISQGTRCADGCIDGGGFWHRTLVQKKNALFWRCAWLWSLGHKVGSSDSVWEQELNTSCQPHGGPKCGGRRSSRKLGPLFLEVRGGFN